MSGGQLIIPFSTPVLSSIGEVAAGAVMDIYNTGTLTLASVYADVNLTTPIVNPLTANSAGRFTDQATLIWASDANAYDVALNFPDGSVLTFDNIYVLEAQQSLSGFAPINSPAFTGIPTAPTPGGSDNSNKIATTAYVKGQNFATLNSPAFTGTPTAPTPASGDNSTDIATTAFIVALTENANNSLTTNSLYYTFPGGLIMQAGIVNASSGSGSHSLTFPHAFPNACVFANAIMNNSSTATSTPTGIQLIGSPTTTVANFNFVGYQSGTINPVAGFFWIAWGW